MCASVRAFVVHTERAAYVNVLFVGSIALHHLGTHHGETTARRRCDDGETTVRQATVLVGAATWTAGVTVSARAAFVHLGAPHAVRAS